MRSMLGLAVWLVSLPFAAHGCDMLMSGLEWHMVTKAIVFSYLSVAWFVFLQTWRFDFQAGNRISRERFSAAEEGMILKFPTEKRKAQ